MKQSHDVLIIGGGFVGASLAIALGQNGINVGLVESSSSRSLSPVFDQRHLVFAAASMQALTQLGVAPFFANAATSIQRVHISQAGHLGCVELVSAQHGCPSFGSVVLACAFGHALDQRLQQITTLTRYRPFTCVGLGDVRDGWRSVHIVSSEQNDDARDIRARLVVGCDGTYSTVRDLLQIRTEEHDYRQTLALSQVQLHHPPDGTAWERFGASGPTALLPRVDGRFGVIHCFESTHRHAMEHCETAAWIRVLQKAIGWRHGRILHAGERHFYPLRQVVAAATCGQRAVIMGNAAQTIHPIGAQGFNLGLRDALTLAELIQVSSHDPGADNLLSKYQQRRAVDRSQTIAFSYGLAHLTSYRGVIAWLARSAGFMYIAHQRWLQALIASESMGFRGDVPYICRGRL